MYGNLKKTTTSFVTSLLACTVVCAAEPVKANKGILNPPAQPYVADGLGLYVDTELLLWKARETGLDYAVKSDYQGPFKGNFVTNLNGSVKNPDFNWDIGFRLGVGLNSYRDGWDLCVNWTHLHTTASDSTTAKPNVGTRIFPEFQAYTVPDKAAFYNEADAHWRLQFDTVDFELGREFFVSRRLTLRPNIGLRGAWIHQDYDVNYSGQFTTGANAASAMSATGVSALASSTSVATILNSSKVEMRNNFNSIGPRIGVNADWILGAGFSLFGEAALSLLYGDFKLKYQERGAAFTRASSNFISKISANTSLNPSAFNAKSRVDQADLREKFRDARAATDLAIGIRWVHKFYNNRNRIGLQVGWDQHIFFGQNQFIAFVNELTATNKSSSSTNSAGVVRTGVEPTSKLEAKTRRRGDLSLQGVTFAARLDF